MLDVGSLVSLDKREWTWHKDKTKAAASLEGIDCVNKSNGNMECVFSYYPKCFSFTAVSNSPLPVPNKIPTNQI